MKRVLTPKPTWKFRTTKRRRVTSLFLFAPAAPILLVGCPGSYDMELDEPCRQAGFAIASRHQACTGDADAANALYERFVDEYACTVAKLSKDDYRCAYNLNALDCQAVEALRDDLPGYLTEFGCIQILRRKDGAPMPLRSSDGTLNPLTTDAECAAVALRLAEFEAACGGGSASDLYFLIVSDLAQSYSCSESATDADVNTCRTDLDELRCIDFSIARDLLEATPSCQDVISPREGSP